MFAHPRSPVSCPQCGGKSFPRHIWRWSTAFYLIFFAVIAYKVFNPGTLPLHNYGGVTAAILLLICVDLAVLALLPLVPCTEAHVREAKRWRLVQFFAAALLFLVVAVNQYVGAA